MSTAISPASQIRAYQPRNARAGPLYRIVHDHLETFLVQGRDNSQPWAVPSAQDSLRAFLECGVHRFGVDKLAIYSFNSSTNRWERDVPSSVDKAGKVVTGNTPHFSLFGLSAPAAADLSSVLVYPVPFVPNDGLDDNGKPFASGDSNSGIIFDSITQSVAIRVYAVTGELVWERTSAASSGKVQWDGRNLSGQEVASGVYVAVIPTPETGSKVAREYPKDHPIDPFGGRPWNLWGQRPGFERRIRKPGLSQAEPGGFPPEPGGKGEL